MSCSKCNEIATFNVNGSIYCRQHTNHVLPDIVETLASVDCGATTIKLDHWKIVIERPDIECESFNSVCYPVTEIFNRLEGIIRFIPVNESVNVNIVLFFIVDDLTLLPETNIINTSYGNFLEVKKQGIAQAYRCTENKDKFIYPMWQVLTISKRVPPRATDV